MKIIFKKNKLYSIPKRSETTDVVICSDEFGAEFDIMDVLVGNVLFC